MASFVDMVSYLGWELILTCVVITISVTWYIRSCVLPIAANLPPGPPRIPSPFHLVAGMAMVKKGLSPLFDLKKK